MSSPSNRQYLEGKILTVPQPQLHLMLLDGALRFGRQARETWTDDVAFERVDALLARMSDVVDELTHSAAAGHGEIAGQLEEQYAFVYRELVASRFNEDRDRLDASLELLAYQRETWKLACEAFDTAAPSPSETPLPHLPSHAPTTSAGFSLEA